MTDKERKDIYYLCRDTKVALETEKSRLENATLQYLYAINRHYEHIEERLNDILNVLNVENMEDNK